MTWPELVRSAKGAFPVVMLDGFDELLQASGANLVGGHLRVNPGEQPFHRLLRQEFEVLGFAFPEDLFA